MTRTRSFVGILAAAAVSALASGCMEQDPAAPTTERSPVATTSATPSATPDPTTPDPSTEPTASTPKGSSQPVYYAFAFDTDPDSPGCGPQARFVKVDGSDFFEVAGFGCDASADRGTISGDQVDLVGTVHACGRDGLETYPTPMTITGGPRDLRIPGETRVVGPTTDPTDLDHWWSEENEQVPYPSPRDANHVSGWMRSAAADKWIGNGC